MWSGTFLASELRMGLHPAPGGSKQARMPGGGETLLVERSRPRGAERAALLDWLDDGLRGGRRGRLLAEYGPLLAEPGAAEHVVCRVGGTLASHVLWRVAEARAGGVTLPIGMIGLVYTDPRFRGQGLATRALEVAQGEIAARGAVLAALWSEKREFYARQGFAPGGVERMFRIDAAVCASARSALGAIGSVEVGVCAAGDWPRLEALHAARASRVLRPAGWLLRLAAAPDCELRVARRAGRITAYAACGRGDDLQGVIHDWAGEPAAVLACAASLLGTRSELRLLAGPELETVASALRLAGAEEVRGDLALIRLLDASRLPGGLAGLSRPDASAGWPLFVWGFDSI